MGEEDRVWFQEDGKLAIPGQDVVVSDKETLMYKFYRKPMSSPFQILNRSAVPEGVKVATAVQEVLRRWKTTSTYCSRGSYETITIEYMDMLAANGYPEAWRRKILEKALIGYRR